MRVNAELMPGAADTERYAPARIVQFGLVGTLLLSVLFLGTCSIFCTTGLSEDVAQALLAVCAGLAFLRLWYRRREPTVSILSVFLIAAAMFFANGSFVCRGC